MVQCPATRRNKAVSVSPGLGGRGARVSCLFLLQTETRSMVPRNLGLGAQGTAQADQCVAPKETKDE